MKIYQNNNKNKYVFILLLKLENLLTLNFQKQAHQIVKYQNGFYTKVMVKNNKEIVVIMNTETILMKMMGA